MLSRKIKNNEGITLMKTNEIIKRRKGTAKVLNSFFSNLIYRLEYSTV